MRKTLLTVALGLVAGFAGAAGFVFSGLGNSQVERYLLANPDLLPRMAEAFDRQRAEERLAKAGDDVRQPFAGAILGNPEGTRTLVKFTDYNCGFCRNSAEELIKMVKQDPELRVIMREWPIFEGSDMAAKMALAAGQQGKYGAFYEAVFIGGDTSDAGLAAAAQTAGLDLVKLKEDAAAPQIAFELNRNMQFAQELGFSGTPSWIIGNKTLEGAVPAETLTAALDESAGSES